MRRLTSKQEHVLANISNIRVRVLNSGMHGYFLGDENLRTIINSLLVSGYLTRDTQGRLTRSDKATP